MATDRLEKTFIVLVLLLAAYQLVVVVASVGFGIGLWGGNEEGSAGQGWYLTLPTSAVGLAFIWAGIRQRTQAPLRAGVLIAVGVLPSILMFWMIVPPIIAFWVAVYAVYNGRRQQRGLETGA